MKKCIGLLALVFLLFSFCATYAETIPKTTHTKSVEVTTGAAITFPVVVALIALASSALSIYISIVLKDKEYRNDYFKKVIEKRIKAVEKAEMLVFLFGTTYGIEGSDKRYHCYMLDFADSNKLSDAIDAIAEYNIWYGNETGTLLVAFSSMIFPIIGEAKRLRGDSQPNAAWQTHCTEKYGIIETARAELSNSLARDMYTLHDVNGFFKAKLS